MKCFSFSCWRLLCILIAFAFVTPYVYIWFFSSSKIHTLESIQTLHSLPEKYVPESIEVAIVFGAAAWKNGPSDVFADRLSIAAELYNMGKIKKILISGDNSNIHYNEPETGKKFLVQQENIPAEDIVLDYAGFRTYDTCMRAYKLWDINEAFLVTQAFHLPRSIFTCEHIGITSVGVSASTRAYKGGMKNIIRESLAQQKAFYEVLFIKPQPIVLGEKESLGIE